jgi:hypothetical protein
MVKPDSSGQLVDDVRLDEFSTPWNAMPDAGKLAPGIPSRSSGLPTRMESIKWGACIRPRDLSRLRERDFSAETSFTMLAREVSGLTQQRNDGLLRLSRGLRHQRFLLQPNEEWDGERSEAKWQFDNNPYTFAKKEPMFEIT